MVPRKHLFKGLIFSSTPLLRRADLVMSEGQSIDGVQSTV